ncbi:putative cytochrome P450 [Leptodontidium sp. MPI-SDFR-AT-0119]|nr:putative cytochrome P450 [Leptodontidium sp. MPI-SDFR-AT-0119]
MGIFSQIQPQHAAALLVVLGPVYISIACVYHLFFHPLSKYPGPLLAKVTDLYSVYHNYIGDIHIDALRCHEQYGTFVRYGPNKLINNSATGYSDIYSYGKNIGKGQEYDTLAQAPISHRSILSSTDKKEHGRKRRVIGQGFNETALRGYESIIQSKILLFCEKLLDDGSSGASGGSQEWSSPRNMAEWCECLSQTIFGRVSRCLTTRVQTGNYLSFDIMANVVFSHPLDLLSRPDNRYIVHAIDDMMYRVGVLSQIPQLLKWRASKWIIPKGKSSGNRFVEKATQIAMARLQGAALEGHRDAFQNLIDAKDSETGEGLPIPELLAETVTLIVAGSDTTASAFAATFFYLSRNPEALIRLNEEVRSTFQDASDIHSGPELRSCTYLRACVDEAMRLNPPVSSPLWREVLVGGAEVDGEFIGQGVTVGTGMYALQHNPEYFPRPFRYLPERWIESEHNPAEKIEEAKKAFFPFSIGSRMCAAEKMARLELVLTVAHVVWAMDLKIADGPIGRVGQGGLTMGPGREREDEFQVIGHFVTVGKDGPVLQFRKREQSV